MDLRWHLLLFYADLAFTIKSHKIQGNKLK